MKRLQNLMRKVWQMLREVCMYQPVREMCREKKAHSGNSLINQLEAFFRMNYDFRYNLLTECAEYREKGNNSLAFRTVNQRVLNSLCIGARRRGMDCWDRDVARYLCSDSIADYHPFRFYMDSLPEWDGEDRVRALAKRVSGDTLWIAGFHRWMLALAAQWMEMDGMDYDIYPGKNLTNNYDIVRNWDYIYTTTFSKNGSQLSSDKRVLVASDLSDMPSNSYIMLPGKSYKFNPRIKGEGQSETGGVSIPLTHEVDEIRLTWQDTQSLIQSIGMTDDRSSAVVTIAPGKTGNAVASAYSGGSIVWSWHLWVKSTQTGYYTTNNIKLMSSNLGALNYANNDHGGTNSLGLLYQWGRNIPFPAANADNANTVRTVYDIDNNIVTFMTHQGAESIGETVANPTVFYYSNVAGDSWHSDGTDLWGGTSGIKTIFDPSPRGWKVERDHTAWNNWTNADNLFGGFAWKSDKLARLSSESGVRGYFPASGFYTDNPGGIVPALNRVGDEGRYWTAIFENNQAGILRFTSKVDGSTDPDNDIVERVNVNQSYGCSVRPMKL